MAWMKLSLEWVLTRNQSKTQREINRLVGMKVHKNSSAKAQDLREELKALANQNLGKATFTEKRDIISKLGIRVYPSEDLKTVRIQCSLDFRNDCDRPHANEYAIIQVASLLSQ